MLGVDAVWERTGWVVLERWLLVSRESDPMGERMEERRGREGGRGQGAGDRGQGQRGTRIEEDEGSLEGLLNLICGLRHKGQVVDSTSTLQVDAPPPPYGHSQRQPQHKQHRNRTDDVDPRKFQHGEHRWVS